MMGISKGVHGMFIIFMVFQFLIDPSKIHWAFIKNSGRSLLYNVYMNSINDCIDLFVDETRLVCRRSTK